MAEVDRRAPLRSTRWSVRAVRRWSRLQLPGAYELLRAAGVWNDAMWREEPHRVCRGWLHGYRMKLDIRDFHQRAAYFYGRTLDVAVLICLHQALRRGDAYVDVGANIGVTTMIAARAVGPSGRVLAFEPNPVVHEHLLWHVSENALRQAQVYRVALSDQPGTMQLRVPANNCGAATLGSIPPRYGRLAGTHAVEVRTGDDVLRDLPPVPLLIKIDVEGHETRVLRGLQSTLSRHRPAVLLECNPEMLPRNETSVEELLALMNRLGYEPFLVKSSWSRLLRRWSLRLQPVAGLWRPERLVDVLFLPPGGVHKARLRRFVERAAAASGAVDGSCGPQRAFQT